MTRRSVRAQYCSRSLNFLSLPVAVRGSSSTNSTEVGHLKWAITAERDELVLVRLLSFAEDHESLGGFAPLRVGDADDRALEYCFMLIERVLNLGGADVFAA